MRGRPISKRRSVDAATGDSATVTRAPSSPAVVVPLVTSHAPMLGRTLLYTALTRARRLLVLVGQKKALYLAVPHWRRTPRHTALGGLLDRTLRFEWKAGGGGPGQPIEEEESAI